MGRVLAIDPGTVRVGLAVSDTLRITAQPLEVIATENAVDRITAICSELEIEEIVIGLPVTERGELGESVERARQLRQEVESATGLNVVEIDERYTSRMADKMMIQGGARRRTRRQNLDKVAAAVILRTYLDRPRSNP